MKNYLFAITCIALLILTPVKAQKKKQNIFKELFGVSVQETSDKFDGTTTYQMEGNRVFSQLSGTNALGNLIFGTDAPTFKTFLNLEKQVLKNGAYELAILFKVEADNEQFAKVMEGESLIFLLDYERFDLTTKGSYNSDFDIDIGGVSSVTNARYAISEDQLEKINSSDKVEFRIILDSYQSGAAEGRDKNEQYLDGEFNKKNKRVWNEFEVDYLND
ncbi:hypothetical protein RQM65_09885 [Pricia sp. S334]|uniref:Uncharacterized protein n=1 Tax=Pricia mediterranea TaxID=3076079 RepID=A0ABU3L5F4_9FLAO|nr:hypothetical protein [Pricia sp. S334]MDT7828971.1 hypothetical protein [Pricia sp. S334]